jgi:hypothetical protein
VGASRVYNGRTKTTPFPGYQGRIVEYPLQHEAATTWASGILPAAFVSSVNFAEGSWTAPLPEGTPEEVANRFSEGVLAEPPTSEWRPFDRDHFGPEMSERIAASLDCTSSDLVVVPKASLVLFAAQWAIDHLGSSPSAVALIREMHPQPNLDAVMWTSSLGILYPVSGSRLDRDGLANLMDLAADSSGELMILTSSGRFDPSAARALVDSDLVELVAGADAIVLGAYDGEGYVHWSRAQVACVHRER